MKSNLSVFFMASVSCVSHLRNVCLSQDHEDIFLCFLPEADDFAFSFKSVIHLKLIFV